MQKDFPAEEKLPTGYGRERERESFLAILGRKKFIAIYWGAEK